MSDYVGMGQDSDIIQSVLKQNANQQGPAVPNIGQDSDILQALIQNPEKVSPTGYSVEPYPMWQQGYKALTDRLAIGNAEANKATAGWLLASGKDLEAARNEINTQEFLQAQTDTHDYINTHAHYQLFKLRQLPGWDQEDESGMHMADIPGWMVQQIPSLAPIAMGAGYGALAGAMFGPGGVAAGALYGSALATGTMMFGSHVYDSMERGVDRQHAVIGGAFSGAVGGVTTVIGMGAMGKVVPKAASAVFASSGFKQAIAKAAGTMLKGAGINIAAGDVQSIADSSAKYFETRASNLDKPFTIQEGVRDLAMATAQSATVTAGFEALAAPGAIHAGMRAKAIHAQIEKMTANFQAEQAALAEKEAVAALDKHTALQASTEVKTIEQKAVARKALKGFLQVDQPMDTASALSNLNDAIQAHNNAPKGMKAQYRLAVKQAEAELQQAKYTARGQAIEEALTEPDLVARSAEHIADLERDIEFLKDKVANEPKQEVWKAALAQAQANLKEVKQIATLGTHENIRKHLEGLKAQLTEHAQETQLSVAAASLKRRMSERDATINKLRGEIRAEKKAAREAGEEYKAPDAAEIAARVEASPQIKKIDKQIAKVLAANEKEFKRLLAERAEIEAKRQAEAADNQGEFHGTSEKIEQLSEYGGSGEKNLYGPGFYVTASRNVAQSYTGKGKGKNPTVYKVKWLGDKPAKLFDLDAVIDAEGKEHLIDGDEYMPMLENVDGMTAKHAYAKFKEALADHELYPYEAHDEMLDVQDRMKAAGYDGFTHMGGGKFKKKGQVVNEEPHKVTIYFDVNKIGLEELPPPSDKPVENLNIQDLQRKIEEANPVAPLAAKREQLVGAIKADVEDGVPHAATAERRERLETLRQQQELDNILRELIAEKSVLPEDIADLSPQVPTKRLLALVKVAQKQIDRAAAASGAGQKKLMKSAKRLLDSLIDTSRLPAGDKHALKASYDVVDLKKLQDALPALQEKIAALFEKRRLKAAHADLKAQLDSIQVKAGSESKTPGTEEMLMTIKLFAKDPSAIERLEITLDMKEVLDDLEEAQLELAQLFPVPVKEMTVPQIERIIDNIVSLRETGKAEALRRLEERQARQSTKREILLKRMEPTARGRERLNSEVVDTVRKIWDDVANSQTSSWRGLMTIISQFGEMHDMADILDIKSALSESHKQRIKWENRWKELVDEAGLSTKEWHQFNIKAHKRGEKIEYIKTTVDKSTGLAINEQRVLEHPNSGKALNLWEMIQVRNYLLDADLDAISRLSQGNRFSYKGEAPRGWSTLEAVESYLSDTLPHWRAVADAQRQFYKEFHPMVDDTAFRRFGRHIPMNETYGGKLLSSGQSGGRFREGIRRMTLRPGSVLERQGGKRPVEIRSAMQNLTSHIAEFTREHALLEFEQDAQALFRRDENTRQFIERNIGKNTVKVIDKFMEDIVLGHNRSHDIADQVTAWLRESLYSRFLGARPEQFAKQLAGISQGMHFIGVDKMLDGYAYMLASPKETAAMMHESGLLQARASVRDPDFRPEVTNQLRRFNSSLMKAVEVGDHYAIYGSSFPVYLDVLRKTGDKSKALKAFETAFDTTQSSGSVDELPHLFRGNAMTRMLVVMAQEPARQIEHINTAWRKFQNMPTHANFHHYARVTAVAYLGAFLYNAIGYMVMYPLLTDDQREQKLNYILDIAPLGPLSGTALLGNLLSAMSVSSAKMVFNQNTRAHEPELISADVTSDFYVAFEKIKKLAGDDGADAKDCWNAILAAGNLIGDVTGLPISNVLSTGGKIRSRFAGEE